VWFAVHFGRARNEQHGTVVDADYGTRRHMVRAPPRGAGDRPDGRHVLRPGHLFRRFVG